jgi:D-glycero-D-manno-heptose 1,7-bisphosphate phosphatase
MSRAIFLDRDGVISAEVYYPHTGEWEAPLVPEDLALNPGALEAMGQLAKLGYLLIIISNQPAYAKGKTSLEALFAVHDQLVERAKHAGIDFAECYYSYSHPEGIVPGFSGPSLERKPGTYFVRLAEARFALEMAQSWFIGDRDSDITCGRNAGVRTIRVMQSRAGAKAGREQPDFQVINLAAAAQLIAETV